LRTQSLLAKYQYKFFFISHAVKYFGVLCDTLIKRCCIRKPNHVMFYFIVSHKTFHRDTFLNHQISHEVEIYFFFIFILSLSIITQQIDTKASVFFVSFVFWNRAIEQPKKKYFQPYIMHNQTQTHTIFVHGKSHRENLDLAS
jgi:hypothetical protein